MLKRTVECRVRWYDPELVWMMSNTCRALDEESVNIPIKGNVVPHQCEFWKTIQVDPVNSVYFSMSRDNYFSVRPIFQKGHVCLVQHPKQDVSSTPVSVILIPHSFPNKRKCNSG